MQLAAGLPIELLPLIWQSMLPDLRLATFPDHCRSSHVVVVGKRRRQCASA